MEHDVHKKFPAAWFIHKSTGNSSEQSYIPSPSKYSQGSPNSFVGLSSSLSKIEQAA